MSLHPPPREFAGHVPETFLDALVEVARVLETMPLGRGELTSLVQTIESATQTRIRLVLHLEDGQPLDAESSGPHTCLNNGSCLSHSGGRCPVVSLHAASTQEPSIGKTSDCLRRAIVTQASTLVGGRICVPVLVGGEALGSLSAETLRTEPDDLHDLERFLTVVAALIAVDVRHRTVLERERTQLAKENLRLRDALGEKLGPDHIIGSSRPMRDVYARISQVASSDTTVLIRGESGTGKELVASALHYASSRAKGPFVRVNVAALGESLLESELFGHEKGAFTGALQSRIGRIEEAQGGTLFLDEIGDFSPVAQVKLLRVLQEREFERVGSNRTIHADVRIIAATNRNLESAVTEGAFRNDLYYRINVFPLNIPPLRARPGDILLLANHFAEIFARRMTKTISRISTPAIDALLSYHWPGNVRELENAIEHAVLLATDDVIFEHNLPPTLQLPHASNRPTSTLAQRVESMERDMIQDALKRTSGNVAAAARELGLTARVTRYKIKTLQLHVAETHGQMHPTDD